MPTNLQNLFKEAYLVSFLKNNPRWTALFETIGKVLQETVRNPANNITDLINVWTVNKNYVPILAETLGIKLHTPPIQNFPEIQRKQILDAVFWLKYRGTADAIKNAARSYGIDADVYYLFTGGYQEFIRLPIDIFELVDLYSDTGLYSDMDYYREWNYMSDAEALVLSSHFEIELNLIRKMIVKNEEKLLDLEIFKMIRDRIDNHVKPVVTYPHYSTNLVIDLDYSSNVVWVDGHPKGNVNNPHYWRLSENDNNFQVNMYPPAEIYSKIEYWDGYFEKIDKFKVGTRHYVDGMVKPLDENNPTEDLEHSIYENIITEKFYDSERRFAYFECYIHKNEDLVSNKNISEFAIYSSNNPNVPVLIASFPKIEMSNYFGKYFRVFIRNL